MDSVKVKSVKEKYTFFVIVGVVLISSIVLILLIKDSDKKEEVSKTEDKTTTTTTLQPEVVNNHFNYNYEYIIDYEHLSIPYLIYLLKDKSIRLVSVEQEYAPCLDQNCIQATGKKTYTEISVNLNNKALEKVRKVIPTLFTDTKKRELDLTKSSIGNDMKLVFDGLIEGNNDKVNLSDDLKIEEKKENLKNSNGGNIFSHSYNYIADSENAIVKTIANHINSIVTKDYQDMFNYSKEFVENIEPNDYLGVSLKLKIESLTDEEVSISYITEGSLGGTTWFIQHGYVYSISDGNLKEYKENKKENAYKSALENFKQSELYFKESSQLFTNYEAVLKDEMFKTGNYYLTNSEIVFAIDGSLLGFNSATAKVVEIRIARDNNY